ncbi:CTP synthase [Bienertia sinuspersici]
MKQLTSQLQSFTVELVPRGENVQADVLSRLASSTLQDLKRSVFVEVLPKRSTDTNGEYEFLNQYHVKFASSTVCHPLPNGLAEVANKQILNSLQKKLEEKKGKLDLVEEVREQTTLRMQAYLGKVAKHYNRRVKIKVLQVGNLVLRKTSTV